MRILIPETTTRKLHLISLLILIGFFSCQSNQVQTKSIAGHMKTELTEIKSLIDKALLSDNPIAEFKNLLPKVKEYKSIDSAWMTNSAFYVKVKNGAVLSWLIQPDKANSKKH